MKQFIMIILLFLTASCKVPLPKEPTSGMEQIPHPILLSKQAENILVKNDTVYRNNKKYSGFLYQLQPGNRDTFSMEGYYNGLLTGACKKWYPNRRLMEERLYNEGKKNEKQQSFWNNGHKRFEFIASNDI